MTNASTFMRNILDLSKSTDEKTAPFVAFVYTVTANKAMIYRPEEDNTYAFEATVLYPFTLATNDVVLACYIGRSTVVIGKIQQVSPGIFNLVSGLNVTGTVTASGLLTASGGASVTGNVTATGSVTAASFNSPLFQTETFSAPTVTSTTDTVNYQEAITTSLVLPVGNWAVYALGGCNLKHSAQLAVNCVVEIDGVTDTVRTVTTGSLEYLWITDEHARTVAGNRTITIRYLYKCSGAGTTTAKNPSLMISARRTS